jgi:hypothetical protein
VHISSFALDFGCFCYVEMILKQADLSDSSDERDSYVKSVLQYYIHKSCSFFFMLQTSSHFEVTYVVDMQSKHNCLIY